MRVAEQLSALFDIPAELACGVPRVTITGGKTIQIENRGEITEFSRERICLHCGRIRLTVSGNGMELVAMSGTDICLRGSIHSVEVG